jgi:hypothetical protein
METEAFEPLADIKAKLDKLDQKERRVTQDIKLERVRLIKKAKKQIEDGLHEEYTDIKGWLKDNYGLAPTTLKDYPELANSDDEEMKLAKRRRSNPSVGAAVHVDCRKG